MLLARAGTTSALNTNWEEDKPQVARNRGVTPYVVETVPGIEGGYMNSNC
jgi:hypothetical protein